MHTKHKNCDTLEQRQRPYGQTQTHSTTSHHHRIGRNQSRSKITDVILLTSLFINLVSFTLGSPVYSQQFTTSFQTGRNIRHLPCVARKTGLKGICMFAIDCLKSNGTHLGTCIDKFYFGSCCQLQPDVDTIYHDEIVENSIDQNILSNFQHYTSPQRPLVPVSTISAPTRRNITQFESSTRSAVTRAPVTHLKNDSKVSVTTENIRLSTFQMVETATKVTTPLSTLSSQNTSKKTSATTNKPSSVKVSTTQKVVKTTQRPVEARTTTRVTRPSSSLSANLSSGTMSSRTTPKPTPPSETNPISSLFSALAQKTTTTVQHKPTTAPTSHSIPTGYRNLTNRVTTQTPTKTTQYKPVTVTQTKAPRPKPKPTADITIVPPTSLSHLTQETEFTTVQFVTSSKTTTPRTKISSTPISIVQNSTSYVTSPKTQRPITTTVKISTTTKPTTLKQSTVASQKPTKSASTVIKAPVTKPTKASKPKPKPTSQSTVASTKVTFTTTRTTQKPVTPSPATKLVPTTTTQRPIISTNKTTQNIAASPSTSAPPEKRTQAPVTKAPIITTKRPVTQTTQRSTVKTSAPVTTTTSTSPPVTSTVRSTTTPSPPKITEKLTTPSSKPPPSSTQSKITTSTVQTKPTVPSTQPKPIQTSAQTTQTKPTGASTQSTSTTQRTTVTEKVSSVATVGVTRPPVLTTRKTQISTTKPTETPRPVSASGWTTARTTVSSTTTTPKPLPSSTVVSSTQSSTSARPAAFEDSESDEEGVELVTWTSFDEGNDTKDELQPDNWILVSSGPSSEISPMSTISTEQVTSTSVVSTVQKETTVQTTSKRTTTAPPSTTARTPATTSTTSRPKITTRAPTSTVPSVPPTTTQPSRTTASTTQRQTTSTTTSTQPTVPFIDDTGTPVLLLPTGGEDGEEDSDFESLGYTTEKIIGTSTSTSIQVNPISHITEPSVGATFQDMHQNSSYPPGFESTPSTAGVFEYNATMPSIYNHTFNSDFFTQSTTPIPQLEGVDYKTICGKRMFPEPRIVGGAKASFGRWPWQISLRQWRTSTYLHKCGAALLNENWAITAAHCVDNVPPSDLLLRLGEYDLAVEEEPYGYQERRVQIVASHPQFDPRTFEYDLALLRFYEPVIFQPNIIPVCVPDNDENFIGRTAYVTGWGRLYEDGPLPSVLQEVTVPVIENAICEGMYRQAGYIEHIPHIFICAGWKKGGYDSCEGDSGGPMVIQRPDKRFLLAGIISWGIGCAEPNQPGVYTRISEFRDWINQILQF